ncbi:MAG: PilN domain-containing protein [Deltaproteobacteria bacterium]|nr:PilN domain-containing protein [Deltaproteobacteria bacterium]MBW2070534.1 PilN domain-containing protein [Deltaproteobacteria bacterium]
MIRINLLPVRRRKVEEVVRKEVSVFFLLLLFCVAVMAFVHIDRSNEITRMTQEKNRLEREIKRHQTRQKELRALEKRKKILLQKLQIIRNLEANRDLVPRVLDQLASLVPSDKMWIRKLEQKGSNLTVEGIARGNETIAQFMEALARSPIIDANKVVLKQSKQTVIEGYKLKEFQLTCKVVPPKKKETPKQDKMKTATNLSARAS